MKLDFVKFGVGITAAAALVLMVAPFRAQADTRDRLTVVTFSEPVQVSNTYLEPGTYVFKLADSSNDRHIVEIFNRDENHLINTIMAIPNYRPYRVPKSTFTYWETPPGTVRAMKAWFFPDDWYGQEFRYPTNLRQIAAVSAPAPTPIPPAVQAPVAPEPQAEAVPAPAPEVNEPAPPAPVAEATPAPEPEQLAQNTPPAQPEAAPQPETPATAPSELPKTASPYPLIGLAGVIAAGLLSLLRVKQLS